VTSAPLGLRIRTRPCEPAHGSLVRLSSRMGMRDPRRTGRVIGFPMQALSAGRGVREFALKAGIDPDVSLAASPVLSFVGRSVELGGEALRLGDWSTSERRRCPHCVGEDIREASDKGMPPEWWVAHRSWWDVSSVGTCVIHASPLTARCGSCGRIQRWSDPSLIRCRCGAGLWSTKAECVLDGHFSAYVIGRLGMAPAVSVPLLDGLDLRSAIRAAELLGATCGPKTEVKPRRLGAALRRDREVGLGLALDWPDGFLAVLGRLSSQRAIRDADGLIGAYGWVYSELAAIASGAFECGLAEVVRSHAVGLGVMAQAEPKLGCVPPETITATAAARRLGRSYAKTREMLSSADAIPRGSRRGVGFTLDPAAVEALRVCPETTATQVAKHLGVGRSQHRRIAPIVSMAVDQDVERGEATSRWLAGLRATARKKAPGLGTPLPIACRNMSVPIDVACKAIASGMIPAGQGSRSETGLRSILVRQGDLASLRPATRWTTAEGVARRWRIHPETARGLAGIGALGEPDGRGRIVEEAAEAFFDRQVPASTLARERGTSPRAVIASLEKAGITPSFGPPTLRQAFFARADVPTVH